MTGWRLQRVIAELTQGQVAAEAGISLSRLRAIEQGKTTPSKEEADRILRVLHRHFSAGYNSKVLP